MRNYLSVVFLLFCSFPAVGAKPLQSDLKSLDLDDYGILVNSKDHLYAVQSRAMDLDRRVELLLSGAQNLSGDGFLITRQMGLEAQYHINNDWALALGYSRVNNDWSNSAKGLIATQGLTPTVDRTTSRTELRAQYNLFYGKIRLLSDSILFFDQYAGLGWTSNQLDSGESPGPVADIGLAFWIPDWGSVHMGLKDYYYEERRVLAPGSNHNLNVYVSLGFLP
jgi:outer membrane beta-barrel protein